MFFASYSRESCYSIHKKVDIVIWGKMFAPCIDFCFTEGCCKPSTQVLEATLDDLVEDVGRDRSEDIEIWEALPEWVVNRLDVRLSTCLSEFRGIIISEGKGVKDRLQIAQSALGFIIAKLIMGNEAFGAFPILGARDEGLFGVISSV